MVSRVQDCGFDFELDEETLKIFGPDGRRFLTFVELARERNELEAERNQVVEATG